MKKKNPRNLQIEYCDDREILKSFSFIIQRMKAMMRISTVFYKLCHYSKPPLYLPRSGSYYTCVICGRRCEIAIRKRKPFDFIMRMVKAGIEQTSKCIPSSPSLPAFLGLNYMKTGSKKNSSHEERQRNICRKKEELIRKVLCRTYSRRIGGG